jgi:hypothetical protein
MAGVNSFAMAYRLTVIPLLWLTAPMFLALPVCAVSADFHAIAGLRSSLGRYVFGSEISYNKPPPPACLG